MRQFRKKKTRKTRKQSHNKTLTKSLNNLTYLPKYKNIYINESLYNLNKTSNNDILNELITNIIDFRKSLMNEETQKSFSLLNISSNYMLFHYIEKNLIEISYLPDVKTRNTKILLLYKWYKDILQKRNSIKKMEKKSYLESNVNYNIESDHINNEYTNNNDNEYNNESKRLQNEMNEKERIKNILNKKSSFSSEILNKSKKNKSNDDNLNNWNFMTHLYSKKKCSNNLSTIEKNSSSLFLNYIKKEEKQKNKNIILPSLASDLKYSYSYYKPIKSQKSFEIENKIIQSKYKLLAEKRSLESINKTINEFGINRAKLKENINNKHEIKNLIKMYVNNQDKEGLNITSPLLKKYLVKKKEILSKPVCTKREREQSTNKIRNFSTSNILEKYRKK